MLYFILFIIHLFAYFDIWTAHRGALGTTKTLYLGKGSFPACTWENVVPGIEPGIPAWKEAAWAL